MLFGFRDVFQYMECSSCGCIQLLDPPADFERYYPSDYIAFTGKVRSHPNVIERMRRYLRRRRNAGVLPGGNWFDRSLASRYSYPQLKGFAGLESSPSTRILDVGCGSGLLVSDLKELGYENLLGIDRFRPESAVVGSGVKILKGTLEDLVGTMWDLIMFHHSFEHMPHPARTLQLAAALLDRGGCCLIRIPVVGWAWQHYGVNWAQLDAPRHLFLHTEKSLGLLAQAAGLRVRKVTYDSNEFQFWVSDLYAQDKTLASQGMTFPRDIFSKYKMMKFRLRAAQLNAEHRGDSAVFELIKF